MDDAPTAANTSQKQKGSSSLKNKEVFLLKMKNFIGPKAFCKQLLMSNKVCVYSFGHKITAKKFFIKKGREKL